MKIYKKLSVASLGITLATTLLASPTAFAVQYKDQYKGEVAAPCATLHDGFYAGLAGGYDAYSIQSNQNYMVDAEGTTLTATADPSLSAAGVTGGLLGGYGMSFRDFYYLGAELFGNWATAKVHWNEVEKSAMFFNQYFKAKNDYGISLLPGLKFTPSSLVYLKVGYNWAQVIGESGELDLEGLLITTKKTATVHGLSFGLGMEQLIAGNFSLRGEYTHTNYSELDIANTGGGVTDMEPSDNQVMLALLYHFA